jgi:site-specific recombinase XerD
MTRDWRAACAAAGLPASVIPYALRHSSIVRMLKAGLPIRLVAAVHDTSVAMIEKTYAKYIVDASEALLRAAAAPMTRPVGGDVVQMPLRRA